ncbi:MAG: DUF3347 domain-containing protein [Niabella sp.]
MKKFLLFLLILAGGFLVYKFYFKKEKPKGDKPQPIVVSQHSKEFNHAVENILDAYFNMNEGFVNWDSTVVNKEAEKLRQTLKEFNIDELKKDSVIYETVLFPLNNAVSAVTNIQTETEWLKKRQGLQDLSDNLRTLLLTIKYDQRIVYWQECPMAFGEGMSGNWLSNKEDVVNPYLGKKDPKYGDGMLNCGKTKMAINFMPPVEGDEKK